MLIIPSLALLPPLPRFPGPLDPTLGKGLETESPNPPHTTASPAATEERSASVLRATSDLALDLVQLQERSAVPAHALPMGCWPAGRLKEGCALFSLPQWRMPQLS